jgi:2-polyprenyl-3-methyl-5-hydroxy-6-metoxy-1,4-benzoquinol methylase
MFNKRSYEKEVMDNFSLGGTEMLTTLRELRFINRWLGGNAVTTSGIASLISQKKPVPPHISISDLGCGDGEMLTIVDRWAASKGLQVALTGIDANDHILDFARTHTRSKPHIHYLHSDVFSADFALQSFDVITATLFCHHFTDEQLIALLKQLKTQAKLGMVINDLHRHWFAYHSIKWLTHWFSRSAMVKNDAKLSVLRGFSKKDLETILAKAGISSYVLKWCWAFRWKLIIMASSLIPFIFFLKV